MAAIGGFLGLGGGAAGTGFNGPQMPNIGQLTSPSQIDAAYGGAQNSLQQQQALLDAIKGQQGLSNQSQVYNQLQGVVAGTGPNPAQAMLANATGANTANQAALMAGQRGAGANPALIARQAAQLGAQNQQGMAGQAALLQAQQSLGAMGAAGNMANTMAANQIGATTANTAAQQGEQGQLLNAQNAVNQTMAGAQANINNANAGLAGQEMKNQGAVLGGIAGGTSGGIAKNIYAHGGEIKSSFVHHLKSGGMVDAMVSPGEVYLTRDQMNEARGDKSKIVEVLSRAKKIPGKAAVKGDSYKNDTVPARLESGGAVVPRTDVKDGKAAKFLEALISKKGKK